MELQYSAVSVEGLFKERNTIFGQKIATKGLVFELKCESSVPRVLILDEVRLRQVLINLVGNAIKFTDAGKICLRASAVESCCESKSRVELTIEVEDTGIGVPDSQKDKIFGAFEQIDGQKTIKYGGTGLGLAITHRLVSMMQGGICVAGEEGHGAIFRFKLHNVEIAAMESLNVETDNPLDVQRVCFEPATILIVDDIDYNREMLTVYFRTLNFSFIYAVNGQEAIEQARRHHPDMILLDMKMPVMNGYEATRRMKADERLNTIPVIAVTASALKQDESTIAELCDGYLRKPVSRVEMVRELMRFLPHEAGKAEVVMDEKIVEGPVVIPPGAELKKLYHHAMVGDMDELSQFAQTLIAKDERLHPFVRKLQQLAARFQDSDILNMLDKSMKNTG